MYVLITGGGRTGTQLAKFLLSQDDEVHVIEDRPDVLARMHRDLPTEAIHEGNPVDPHVLEQAGIMKADVLAATTSDDEMNLVQCYVARARYNVPRTIARVNNPRDAWLFTELFHVDVAVNQAEILATLIEEEMSMGEMVTLLKLRRGNYSLYEEKISPGAWGIGVAIKDMNLEGIVIAAIIRQGEVIVPQGITIFEAGDEVLAVTDAEGARRLEMYLSKPDNNHPVTVKKV